MGIGPIASLAGGYLQSLIGSISGSSSSSSTAKTTTVSSGNSQDSDPLSPFAQILNSLQQLEQSNPTQYQQVTAKISTNLQTAAQSATVNGNTGLATELTTLSQDFQTASSSGQLPNVQDLAQAIGGGGGHHHHRHGGGGASAGASASSTTTDPTSNLSQYIQSLTSSTSTSATTSLDPFSIISGTLNSAGV